MNPACVVFLLIALAVPGCGGAPERANPAELVLAGDGEMWWVDVDVDAERVRHVEQRRLSLGDPAHRVLWRGDRFVLWGYATYASAGPGERLDRIADDTWFFIPSARSDRVWVTVLDPDSPESARGLKAVREIAADGHVTVPDAAPPRGRWPEGAVTSGLLFARGGSWSVWDPRTGREVSRLDLGAGPGPTHADTIASCGDDSCDELWLTDARTGRRRVAHAPQGRTFQLWNASFSPDGRRLAVPLGTGPDAPADLAVVDTESLTTEVVPGTTVEPYYVFTAWSAAGDQVFITGGDRSQPRTILAYRLGDEQARALRVEVGDFYDLAAR